ncbi:MAG: DUF748 domain-containing protein [Candidatus Polarisedimenticolia bacterium]
MSFMAAGSWRRPRVLAATAAGLLGLYALAGFFLVPWIARSQIVKLARTKLHREATVERVTFNPFTLTGVVEDLELADRDGAPLFGVRRITTNFQVSGLFRRAWRFREIAVDGPSVHARVLADGNLSVADLFEPDPNAPAEEAGARLTRLIVDRFTLSRGRAEFTDDSRSPRFIQVLEPLDLEVRDLSTIPDEKGDHGVTIGLGKDSLLRWTGRQTVDPLRLEGRVELTSIALGRLWEYAAPGHPLVVSEGRADIVLSYEVRQTPEGPMAAAVTGATLKARGIVLRPLDASESWLELPEVDASGIDAAWPESRASVGSVRITGPRVLVRRDPGGAMNWMAAAPSAESDTTAPEPLTPWTASIGEIVVQDGQIVVDDRAVSPETKTTLSGVALRLEKVSTDLAATVKAELTAAINASGQARVSGTIVPGPRTAELDVALTGLDLAPFEPYAVRLPGAEFRSGVASLTGKLSVTEGKPRARFEGTAALDRLQIAGGEELLVATESARAVGVKATVSPHRLRVTQVLLDGTFLKLHIDRQGNLNLSRLGVPEEGEAPPPAPTPAGPAVPVDIGKVIFKNAVVDYTDESLILPFGTKIHALNGDIRDVSTTASAPARVALEGRIAEEGYARCDGFLRLADPFAATDLTVIFRGVKMPDLTPYAAHFAGYSLERGVLDVDVRYRVQDLHLIGDHHMVAKDLTLGPKVEGAEGPGLPVRLAVALLKDKDGRIDLEVQVEGTIDSPEFNYRSIFWQAFKKIMANVAMAPFRAIGRLFGKDQEDLELVGFASGRSELPAPEQEKLTRLAAELAGRGEISLEVEGRFDPSTDAAALRRDRLEARIDAKRTPDTSLDAILEALYTETFSKERLEAGRLEHTKTVGASPTLDAATFYESLSAQLLEAVPIGEADVSALARARAEAIAAALTLPGGLDPARVAIKDPSPVKRKKQGSDLVASEMTMTAKD